MRKTVIKLWRLLYRKKTYASAVQCEDGMYLLAENFQKD